MDGAARVCNMIGAVIVDAMRLVERECTGLDGGRIVYELTDQPTLTMVCDKYPDTHVLLQCRARHVRDVIFVMQHRVVWRGAPPTPDFRRSVIQAMDRMARMIFETVTDALQAAGLAIALTTRGTDDIN